MTFHCFGSFSGTSLGTSSLEAASGFGSRGPSSKGMTPGLNLFYIVRWNPLEAPR